MDREACGIYKGMLNVCGVGASGWCPDAWGIQTYQGCPDAPKHMGVSSQCPKCKSYMPLKKIRGV